MSCPFCCLFTKEKTIIKDQRMKFWDVFSDQNFGAIEPKQLTRIGGIQFGPGVRLNPGTTIGGVDLTLFKGRDLQVHFNEDGICIITGIY